VSKPAARVGDMHTCAILPHVGGPILPPGCVSVLIAGLPAARMGDLATCVGPPDVIVLGSLTALIQGRPAARMGDMTAHGGVIAVGCPTVLIGDVGGGAGSIQGRTMSLAKAHGTPFTKCHCEQAAAGLPPAPLSFNG
jgi:uncharacterized Zn-binding protein involved in type VI secretion